ncbi:MAG: hypothetical protein KatS3mg019_2154 [Fimbriimonadales bacterium]|nr:MAG: hypothetical protein KatS3mg019_2154 [Fimbriimonadales bacterium]
MTFTSIRGLKVSRLLIVIASFIVSLLVTPWLIEPLMVWLGIGANIRGFGHSLGSARWIGLLAWGWLGWCLWERCRVSPTFCLLRWLIGGIGLTAFGILLLIVTDRALWTPEHPTARLRWGGLPDTYSIPLTEQLWYVADRATRLVGLRTLLGSPSWEWNYGSVVVHLMEWFWLIGVALLYTAIAQVLSGWLARRWRFLLDRDVVGFVVVQAWLVAYLSMPLVEWASQDWITIGWQLCVTTIYNGAVFVPFLLVNTFLAHKLSAV